MNPIVSFTGHASNRVIPFPRFPIQQSIRSTTHEFQHAFAQDVLVRLRKTRFENALLCAADEGILVLGSDERALVAPLRAVLELCGGGIAIDEPRLRPDSGARVLPSIALVDVQVPRAYSRTLLRELRSRRARIVSAKFGVLALRIRAELSEREALGFPTWAIETTEGRARVGLRRAPLRRPSEQRPEFEAPAAGRNRLPRGGRGRLRLSWSSSPSRIGGCWSLASVPDRS